MFVAIRLAEGAELARTAIVEESGEAVHLAQLDATLGREARFTGFALLLGGRRVRHEASVVMAGESARCRLDGAYIVTGQDEANIVTTIDHRAPGGETRELIKAVAAGRGHGAFQGRIIVREGAQKTDAHQLSRNLLIGAARGRSTPNPNLKSMPTTSSAAMAPASAISTRRRCFICRPAASRLRKPAIC